MEESNRNLLQLRDSKGLHGLDFGFRNVADGFVEDTRSRLESIELEQKDSETVSGYSGH
ncbi:hypothetical protein N7G274_003788 [Stereocaulon virgatum]|uniref:Uncharacterized protein n=1 Tax=Stereocaulon virgatum TaxID=373712 RepID=A0ABR4ADC3_9LECA